MNGNDKIASKRKEAQYGLTFVADHIRNSTRIYDPLSIFLNSRRYSSYGIFAADCIKYQGTMSYNVKFGT